MPCLKGPDGVNRKTEGILNEHKVRTNIWSYAVGKNGTTGGYVRIQASRHVSGEIGKRSHPVLVEHG